MKLKWSDFTPERRAYYSMRCRCRASSKDSKNYTARGITVCDRWIGVGGFERFLEDVGPKPTEQHQLDRYPNNDGNYEPGNVRWATKFQQTQNTRLAHFVTYRDVTMCLSEWHRASKTSLCHMRKLLRRGGISKYLDRAFDESGMLKVDGNA